MQTTNAIQRFGVQGALMIALAMVLSGCTSNKPDRDLRLKRGYVWYCDGAGGGGITNWAGGLRAGLLEGGYPGSGEIFHWNTGLGVVSDQDASLEYKRNKARKMAQQAAAYRERHPNAPISFVGLSAGTTVAVFGLEEMPANVTVDHAVLCGASISSTYDLTRALSNLDGKMYVFTSEKDGVLGFLVPIAGTADRESGNVPSAGLRGFRMPPSASAETRRQYAKLVTIPWRPEFERLGYRGGHTDVLSRGFVAAQIAPRLSERMGETPTALASRQGKVRNPDYDRWADFGVGTYVVVEGIQTYRGVRTPVRLEATLVSKNSDRLMVERHFYLANQQGSIPAQVHSVIAEAWIDPALHPTTDPRSQLSELPGKSLRVDGRTLNLEGKSIAAPGSYPDWGADLKARVYLTDAVPGHLGEIELTSHFDGSPFEFSGKIAKVYLAP